MNVKISRDYKQYIVISAIKKEDYDFVKKYSPSTLKVKDDDGNDIFAISYNAGRPCVSDNGITFGSVNDDGYLCVTGTLPENERNQSYKNYVLDVLGNSYRFLRALEGSVLEEVERVENERAALAEEIVEE